MGQMLDLINDFVFFCLKYPNMQIESVFNRYIQLLDNEKIEQIRPCFELMIKAGECAREAPEEIQTLFLLKIKETENRKCIR